MTTASIIISSPQGDSIDLISFHGNTLSGFSNIVIVPGSPGGATSMPDITRSTSNHSICSDEETSRQIARQTSPVLFRKRLDTKTEKKENRGSFKIPFSFKGSKRSSQIE